MAKLQGLPVLGIVLFCQGCWFVSKINDDVDAVTYLTTLCITDFECRNACLRYDVTAKGV